jgi:hypothetical protein
MRRSSCGRTACQDDREQHAWLIFARAPVFEHVARTCYSIHPPGCTSSASCAGRAPPAPLAKPPACNRAVPRSTCRRIWPSDLGVIWGGFGLGLKRLDCGSSHSLL